MNAELKTYIDKAIAAGACMEAIEEISKLETVDDVLAHQSAPSWLSWYAIHAIKGPFPAAEAVIAESARRATDYAILAIKGRFPAAEKAIAQDPWCATLYAIHALKGSFPAAEAAIAIDAVCANRYNAFIKSLGE